jgi:mycothiol maleylpyruvate isomerase-like protein
MPVSEAFARSNRLQTERLRALVARLDPAMMAVTIPNGWTVAGVLAHMAFWDRQRLGIMRRWEKGDFCSDAYHGCSDKYHGDLYNDAVQPLLERIPPQQAAAAAIEAAEEIDAYLLEVSDELVATALARADAPNLDRGSHRVGHLDAIEKALAETSRQGFRRKT